MAGDSGGVFGVTVAVGEGGACTLERNNALRSTTVAIADNRITSECHWFQDKGKDIPCLLLCCFRAISLRRSSSFLLPTAALRSFEAFSRASKRSLSRPLPLAIESAGRKGERALGERMGGGERSEGRKLSSSCLRAQTVGLLGEKPGEKGEKGSQIGSSGDARDMEISGMAGIARGIVRRDAVNDRLRRIEAETNRRTEEARRPAPVQLTQRESHRGEAGPRRGMEEKERRYTDTETPDEMEGEDGEQPTRPQHTSLYASIYSPPCKPPP